MNLDAIFLHSYALKSWVLIIVFFSSPTKFDAGSGDLLCSSGHPGHLETWPKVWVQGVTLHLDFFFSRRSNYSKHTLVYTPMTSKSENWRKRLFVDCFCMLEAICQVWLLLVDRDVLRCFMNRDDAWIPTPCCCFMLFLHLAWREDLVSQFIDVYRRYA